MLKLVNKREWEELKLRVEMLEDESYYLAKPTGGSVMTENESYVYHGMTPTLRGVIKGILDHLSILIEVDENDQIIAKKLSTKGNK